LKQQQLLASFAAGFIFALGLGISGMTRPEKIVGFLDVFGHWDPTLMSVMVGAISVHFFLNTLVKGRSSPLFSTHWHAPHRKEITPALVAGSIFFGMGWGLSGFCPGPAMVSLIFVFFMLLGMWLFGPFEKWSKLKR
jgi:uncharacterized protein